MEANKYEVQTGTDKLAAMTKDAKLTPEELREANTLNLKGMSEWVSKERARQKEPIAPIHSDPHEATTDYSVNKASHEEMKNVLEEFDSQIAKLREAYAASREELKQASREDIAKLETAIGIAPEKKDLLAGVRSGDKVEVAFKDGDGKSSKFVGEFSKVENGKIFLKDSEGKERDLGPLSSVESITKSPAREDKPGAVEQPVVKPAEKATEAVKPAEKATEEKKYHKVEKGETLSKIAKLEGTTIQELVALNKISDPSKIFAGQKLELPKKPQTQESPAPAAKDAKSAKA